MILKGVAKSGKPFASSYPINIFACASIHFTLCEVLYTLLYVKQGLSSKLHICVRPHPKGPLGVT